MIFDYAIKNSDAGQKLVLVPVNPSVESKTWSDRIKLRESIQESFIAAGGEGRVVLAWQGYLPKTIRSFPENELLNAGIRWCDVISGIRHDQKIDVPDATPQEATK